MTINTVVMSMNSYTTRRDSPAPSVMQHVLQLLDHEAHILSPEMLVRQTMATGG